MDEAKKHRVDPEKRLLRMCITGFPAGNTLPKPSKPELADTFSIYLRNINSLNNVLWLIAISFYFQITEGEIHARAALEAGTEIDYWPVPNDPFYAKYIAAKSRMYDEMPQKRSVYPPGMAAGGLNSFENIAKSGDKNKEKLQALMAYLLTGAWTAFEAFAGDLWEVVLNIHPRGLSDLNGEKNRFRKGAAKGVTSEDKINRTESQSVSLTLVQKYQYDLSAKMGSILKEDRRVNFVKLEGIREAYARAFFKDSDTIDRALNNPALDALSLVRNVLIHRAGVVDSEYVARSQKFVLAPNAKLGEILNLDGIIVSDLIRGSIMASSDLVIAVDKWIGQH